MAKLDKLKKELEEIEKELHAMDIHCTGNHMEKHLFLNSSLLALVCIKLDKLKR